MIRRLAYLSLRYFSSIKYWSARKLTAPGRFVQGGIVVCAVAGIDTDLTMSYQIFALLLALLLVSLASSSLLKLRFHAIRTLPHFVTVGETFKYRISITNLAQTTKKDLIFIDNLADPRPTYEEYRRFRGGETIPRGFGSEPRRRWQTLISRNQNGAMSEIKLPALPSNRSAEIKVALVPQKRGLLRFTGMTLAIVDPLGLAKALVTIPSEQSLVVLPKRYALPKINLPGTAVYQHGGVCLATSKGDFEEFIGLRDYHPGDPLQRIHWKSFARVGRPVVKEYQDEFFERHALVLDTFCSLDNDHSFEEAVSVAASFVCTVETQENLLDLMFVGADTYTFTAGAGQLHAESMLRILAGVHACPDKPFDTLRNSVLERRALLTGGILILLKWDKPRRDLVDELRVLGLPLLVLVVCDDGEGIPNDVPWLHALQVGEIEAGLQKL